MTVTQKYDTLEFPDSLLTPQGGRVRFAGLGTACAETSAFFAEYLHSFNLSTAYLSKADGAALQICLGTRLPLMLRVLNYPDSAMAEAFGLNPLTALELPVFEFFTAGHEQHMLNESKIIALRLCEVKELKQCMRLVTKANAVFRPFFERRGAELTECRFLFITADDKVVLLPVFHPFTLNVVIRDALSGEVLSQGAGGRGSKRYANFFSNLIRT